MSRIRIIFIIGVVLLLVVASMQLFLTAFSIDVGESRSYYSDRDTTSLTIQAADNWGTFNGCVRIFPMLECGCFSAPVTAMLRLPEGYDANDIMINSVKLRFGDDYVPASWGHVFYLPCFPGAGCCPCPSGCPCLRDTLFVTFDRAAVDEMLEDPCGQWVTLNVTGYLTDGKYFTASDDVYVIGCPGGIEFGMVEVTVEFDLSVFKLDGVGSVACYIQLPEGYDVSDIDTSTFLLARESIVVVQPVSWVIADHNEDGTPDLMVELGRGDLEELLSGHSGDVTLEISGTLTSGDIFGDIVTIRVTNGDEPTPILTPEPTISPEPTPTSMPEPSPTPEPTPTSGPTPTPEPTPTHEPTPTPGPTTEPTPIPESTPTVEPTSTIVPTPTREPTPTPEPTLTPKPTATPEPRQ